MLTATPGVCLPDTEHFQWPPLRETLARREGEGYQFKVGSAAGSLSAARFCSPPGQQTRLPRL
jgi:hypothetical protein